MALLEDTTTLHDVCASYWNANSELHLYFKLSSNVQQSNVQAKTHGASISTSSTSLSSTLSSVPAVAAPAAVSIAPIVATSSTRSNAPTHTQASHDNLANYERIRPSLATDYDLGKDKNSCTIL